MIVFSVLVLLLLLQQRLNNIHISSHLLPEDTFSTVEKVKSTVESCRPLSSVIIKSQRKSNSIKCNTNTKCTDPSSQNIFLSFTHTHHVNSSIFISVSFYLLALKTITLNFSPQLRIK